MAPSFMSSSASSHPGVCSPARMNSLSTITRNTASGSLVPDSISKVEFTRLCSRSPPVRSRKKTAAASVEAMIEPSSSASIGARSSASQAAPPASTAVIITPTVARISDGASTPRKTENLVRSPPSKRITASATEPTR